MANHKSKSLTLNNLSAIHDIIKNLIKIDADERIDMASEKIRNCAKKQKMLARRRSRSEIERRVELMSKSRTFDEIQTTSDFKDPEPEPEPVQLVECRDDEPETLATTLESPIMMRKVSIDLGFESSFEETEPEDTSKDELTDSSESDEVKLSIIPEDGCGDSCDVQERSGSPVEQEISVDIESLFVPVVPFFDAEIDHIVQIRVKNDTVEYTCQACPRKASTSDINVIQPKVIPKSEPKQRKVSEVSKPKDTNCDQSQDKSSSGHQIINRQADEEENKLVLPKLNKVKREPQLGETKSDKLPKVELKRVENKKEKKANDEGFQTPYLKSVMKQPKQQLVKQSRISESHYLSEAKTNQITSGSEFINIFNTIKKEEAKDMKKLEKCQSEDSYKAVSMKTNDIVPNKQMSQKALSLNYQENKPYTKATDIQQNKNSKVITDKYKQDQDPVSAAVLKSGEVQSESSTPLNRMIATDNKTEDTKLPIQIQSSPVKYRFINPKTPEQRSGPPIVHPEIKQEELASFVQRKIPKLHQPIAAIGKQKSVAQIEVSLRQTKKEFGHKLMKEESETNLKDKISKTEEKVLQVGLKSVQKPHPAQRSHSVDLGQLSRGNTGRPKFVPKWRLK